ALRTSNFDRRPRLCPTGTDLTSPLPWRIAPQPKQPATFSSPRLAQCRLRAEPASSAVVFPGVAMRIVLIILVTLATLKVWTQDRTYRTVMGEALVEAYRARAIEVCRKQTAKKAPVASAAKIAGLWNANSEAEIAIGDPDVD